MELLNELLEVVSCERNDKKSNYLEQLFKNVFEDGCYNLSKIESKFHCNIEMVKEKHNVLQYTLYYTITSKLIKGEFHLEIEDGINNGTQLNSYSFDSKIEPPTRYAKVLRDIVLDESMYRNKPKLLKAKSQAVLNRDKHLIFEHERQNNYDNYVTGGNSKMKAKGLWTELYLDYIYEEIEVDNNIV